MLESIIGLGFGHLTTFHIVKLLVDLLELQVPLRSYSTVAHSSKSSLLMKQIGVGDQHYHLNWSSIVLHSIINQQCQINNNPPIYPSQAPHNHNPYPFNSSFASAIGL